MPRYEFKVAITVEADTEGMAESMLNGALANLTDDHAIVEAVVDDMILEADDEDEDEEGYWR